MLFDLIDPDLKADLICGDTLDVLKSYEDKKFNLIVTSPPYNVGKEYEVKQSIENYLSSQEVVIKELIRVLSDDGSICWQIGNYIHKGEVYPLDIYYYQIFKKYGLQLRNRIIWHYGHGLQAKNKFSGRYETILWFTKSDKYTFNLDNVRIPSKYPGKLYHKGSNKGQPSGNPLGKNPSDIWQVILQDWEEEVWDIPNVKANHLEKTLHPCQFPVELVERCVLALTNENSWVLDPFAGVGTSLIAALKNNRNSVGIDKEPKYCEIAKDRLAKLRAGELKTRPINRPIHVPSPGDKVAQVPKSWLIN
ncbi:DNA-methyltransferase [Spirosoma validum]|uniref:Methyltransferase n=1 Tax=Spirosoma validum TaxID=2771355 RepID=A0A927GDG3_9BACT|nr:site-specific DNA-methyltransferase [Spirosoma validum]MBD2753535.1 site-specific DNA-methyltransferase [Spirosoma validum]